MVNADMLDMGFVREISTFVDGWMTLVDAG
jgi:hypothetical protein